MRIIVYTGKGGVGKTSMAAATAFRAAELGHRTLEWLKVTLTWRGGMDGLLANEVSIIPDMEELSTLLCIDDHRASGAYDVIVVDAAPTGETLRLLSLPDALRWWIEQIFPMYRRGMRVARPLVRALTDAPMPPDKVFGSVLDLFRRLDQLHHTLVDPQLTSIRLVLNPEKMVVAEAQRTYTYLSLFGYPTDLVVANRIVPRRCDRSLFR
jgi:arsenite-transporting ATPase